MAVNNYQLFNPQMLFIKIRDIPDYFSLDVMPIITCIRSFVTFSYLGTFVTYKIVPTMLSIINFLNLCNSNTIAGLQY